MADRSIFEHLVVDADGDIRPGAQVTLAEVGGGALAQSIYAAVSGGAPLGSATLTADANGYVRCYADTPARIQATVAGATAQPSYFLPNPADMILMGQSARYLASLRVGTNGTPASALENIDTFNAWAGAALADSYAGVRSHIGAVTVADERQNQANTPNLASVVGVVGVPAAVTALNTVNGLAMGVAGYAYCRGGAYGIGVYGQAELQQNVGAGKNPYPANFVLADNGFTTNSVLIGHEVDVNIDAATNTIRGMFVTGNGSALSVAGGAAIYLGPLSGQAKTGGTTGIADPGGFWPAGLEIGAGAATTAIQINPTQVLQWGVSTMPILFVSRSAGGAGLAGYLFQSAAGDIKVRPNSGTFRVQAVSGDVTIAGTDYLVASASGTAVTGTLSSTGAFSATSGAFSAAITGATTLAVGGSGAGLGIVGQLIRRDAGAPHAVLGFDVTNGGAETAAAKGGIGFIRTGAQGVGKLAFYCDPANDVNSLASGDARAYLSTNATSGGRWIQPYIESAPADAELDPRMLSFWVDEAGNTITVKVKYSTGVVKNLTAPLAIS